MNIEEEIDLKLKHSLDQIKKSNRIYGGVYYTYLDEGISDGLNNYSLELELDLDNIALSIIVHERELNGAQDYLIKKLKENNIKIYDEYEDFEEAIFLGTERESKKQVFLDNLKD